MSKAEAGAFPTSLVVKRRVRRCGLHVGGDPGTVVANFNHDTAVFAVGSDAKLALPTHGVDGIVDEVGPHLIEFAAKRIHQQRNRVGNRAAPLLLFQLVIQDRKRGFQALHDIDILNRRLVHVGVFLDGADQIRNPRSTALDFVQQVWRSPPKRRSCTSAARAVSASRIANSDSSISGLMFLRARSGRQLPQVVLSMTAQQGIDLVFQVADGQRIRRNHILLE